MMTRKHFKAIAQAMQDLRPDHKDREAMVAWRLTVARMADMCEDENPRFDRAKFKEACEE